MTLHLIKLSVGPESLSQLEDWQRQRLLQKKELVHVTRQTPKRAEELLAGGSIYWVIKGWLCARQELLELRPLLVEGVPHCGIVLRPEMIRVVPRRHRPFQGWRYFDGKDAPKDMTQAEAAIPEDMRRELAELGLL